jgi:hypothetical protein
MLGFERWEGSLDAWGEVLRSYPDRQIFQTPAWMRFIAQSQRGEPVVAVLKDRQHVVGHFAGLIVRRAGLRILGSPFPGWTTSYMGIRLRPEVAKRDALAALRSFAFGALRCVHLEMADREFSLGDAEGLSLGHRGVQGFEVDLAPAEEDLFARMTSACRRCIRKAQREGVLIEEAGDASFADDYYTQLQDVFAKQSLVPTYPKQRIYALIEHLRPTGMLLLLRARDPSGRCIATGIFPAMNTHMYFFGGASWREGQILRPNEALQWHAMRYWKQRGITKYDMCGGGEYKRKYGGRELSVPWFRASKYVWLSGLRNLAQKALRLRQEWLGRRHARGSGGTGPEDE